MAGGLEELLHALDGDKAVVGVEVVVDGDEVAVAVGGPLGHAAGGEEPGDDVPRGGLGLEGEDLVVVLAVLDQGLEGVDVSLGDDGLVVVHEVAVVGGQRVGVDFVAGGGGSDNARIVVLSDEGLGRVAQLGKGVGLNEAGELVLREAVQIGAGVDVNEHLVGRSGLGDGVDLGVEGDAELVVRVEVRDLLFGQLDSGFAGPNEDVIGAGELAAGLRSGSSLAAGSRGGSAGSRGRSLLAAGSQCEHHGKHQKHCKNFLHFVSS